MTDNTNTSSETLEVEEEPTQEVTTVVDENDDSTESTQEVNQDDDSKDESTDESQDDSEDDEATKEAMAAMKKLRSENKNLRSRLKDAEAKVQELSNSTDHQAIAQERDSYKQQLEALQLEVRTSKLNGLVIEEARKAGAIEPDAIAAMINQSKIEWNDKGEPTNVKETVAELKSSYKRLFTGVAGNGNAGSRNERGSENEGVSTADRLKSAYSHSKE